VLTDKESNGREPIVIDELLRELGELRELDRRRNAHAPGSAAHDAATLEVDLRSRRLMDRFRDLTERRPRAIKQSDGDWTRPVDARHALRGDRGALLN